MESDIDQTTEEGIIISLSESQPKKEFCPILVTEEGILTCFREVHLSNAQLLISFTELGIVMLSTILCRNHNWIECFWLSFREYEHIFKALPIRLIVSAGSFMPNVYHRIE